MIYYPIQTLVDAGIKDILLVTGGNHAGEFLRLLGNGHHFGLKHINYTYQEGEGGIAAALKLAKHFADGEKIVVILGDNILEKGIEKYVDNFREQAHGARILIKEVEDPWRFGVVKIKKGKIISIKEKPKKPNSNYIVTGVYMYDSCVFDIIKELKPSKRDELEITDVNNAYIEREELHYDILKGWWTDSGSFDSLLRANNLVARKERKRIK
jgi:glucose-1-phosphate thymidylyltransferase